MTLFVLIFWILFLEAILLLCIGMMFWKAKGGPYGQDAYFPRYHLPSGQGNGDPLNDASPGVETLFDDTHERLDGLSTDVEKLTREVRMLKKTIVSTHPEKPISGDWNEVISSLQQKLDELAESVSALEERPESRELESLLKLERKLEQRMAKLERALASLVKRVPENESVSPGAETVDLVKNEMESLRDELKKVNSADYVRLQSSLTELIDEAISPLRAEMLEISEFLKGKDTERLADNQRIMQGLTAEPPAVLNEVLLGPEERSSRPPRILSAVARERYQDIVELWDRGESVQSISSQTGVEPGEVELIVAGQTNRPGAS